MIDDSLSFCESVVDLLTEEENWTVKSVTSGEEALKIIKKKKVKVVLLDLKMPEMSGLELLEELDKENMIRKNYVIVLTGEITIENAVNSLQYGARDFIQKPSIVEFPENFISRIKKGFEWQKERLLNEELKREKKRAIQESQLIVKSVGHDMSGSYYGSLMLRLQMLTKKIHKIKKIVESEMVQILDENECLQIDDIKKMLNKIQSLAHNGVNRSEGVIELVKFFKELGEKLKHLGNAIAIDKQHRKIVDLTSILQSALHVFLDSKIKENPQIDIIEEFHEKKLPVDASEEDLVRVFLNIIENAYKAMDDVGRLVLKTYSENDKAVVKISDTGCGIAKDKLDKIWRPDFTSWKNATGTGLGLLICRKAVENSNGEISVDSIINKGTTFTIKFNLEKEGVKDEKNTNSR